MAKTAPNKESKAKLYKMVSFKGIESRKLGESDTKQIVTSANSGFKQMSFALNRLGATMNSMALMMESMNSSFKESVNLQIQQQDKIANAQDAALSDQAQRERDDKRDKEKALGRAADDAAEAKMEGANLLAARTGYVAGFVAGKVGQGIMGFLQKLGSFFFKLVGYAALDWISKNPEKVQKMVEAIAKIGKFVYKIASWLTGVALGGISDFMENPKSFKGIFGLFKFFMVLGGIFAGPALIKAGLFALITKPKAVLKPVMSLLKGLGKFILNLGKIAAKGLFKVGKFAIKNPKAALIMGGVALAGWGINKMMNRGDEEQDSDSFTEDDILSTVTPRDEDYKHYGPEGGTDESKAFIESAAQDIKAKVAKDAEEGSKKAKGGGIGATLKKGFDFIMKPILGMFDQIKKIFGNVIGFFKKQLDATFGFFGEIFTTIKDFLSPYIAKLKNLVQTGLEIYLMPFFKVFDAVKKVMAAIRGEETSGSDTATVKDGDNDGKAKGGKLMTATAVAALAAGGWINGPQEGYAVSLDGRGTDFIGHGLEYVAQMSKGGFVIPFDTPATRKDPSLTGKRMKEAALAGYRLPGFEEGGQFGFAKEMIKLHEGLRLQKYQDSLGFPTIGYGHLIENNESIPDTITKQEADKLFDADFTHHKQAAERIKGWKKATEAQKAALIDLTFNMGPAWADGFPAFRKAFAEGDYNKAGEELKDSAWYGQVGRRADTIINLIKGKDHGADYMNFNPPSSNTGVGERINQSQKAQDERLENAASQANVSVSELKPIDQPAVGGGGGGKPQLIGLPKKQQAAAEFMIPKFGLMNENHTPVGMLT